MVNKTIDLKSSISIQQMICGDWEIANYGHLLGLGIRAPGNTAKRIILITSEPGNNGVFMIFMICCPLGTQYSQTIGWGGIPWEGILGSPMGSHGRGYMGGDALGAQGIP